MARAPGAKVTKTSGQGVSRKSYQAGYRLRNQANTPKVKVDKLSDDGGGSSSGRSYGKSTHKGGGKMNIDYGNVDMPSNLDEVLDMYKGSAPRPTITDKSGPSKKLK